MYLGFCLKSDFHGFGLIAQVKRPIFYFSFVYIFAAFQNASLS